MRKQNDIKEIKILTEVGGIDGWVVDILYKDFKTVTFSVDYGKQKEDGMLDLVIYSIKSQMAASKHNG